MNKKPLGSSILAPSKFSLGFGSKAGNSGTTLAASRLTFPGLKASKLSAVAPPSVCQTSATSATKTTSPPRQPSTAVPVGKPSFLPLGKKEDEAGGTSSSNSSNSGSASSSTSSKNPFVDRLGSAPVFGQNLSERAANFEATSDATERNENGSSAAADSSVSPTAKTLTESAAEYIENHAKKPKYEEVALVTGEEDEANAIQISAKLYLFDKASSTWLERGRGNLRLNDRREEGEDVLSSRLVMRTGGSLRVILNTKLFQGMSVEKPSDKSIRLTGMDEQDKAIKVFLVTGAVKDVGTLYTALASRLEDLCKTAPKLDMEKEAESKKSEEAANSDSSNGESKGLKRKSDSPPEVESPPKKGTEDIIPSEKNTVKEGEEKTVSSTSSDQQFVFGQNISDRAANFTETIANSTGSDSVATEDFGQTAEPVGSTSLSGSTSATGTTPGKTLSESAAEYCESHAQKRTYKEVTVVTGEEGETNAVQVHVKLHLFDKSTSNWVERGRGLLRLNDLKDGTDHSKIASSRLVMRTGGSLRVILNTKLFVGMNVEKPSDKTIRFMAVDEQEQDKAIKVFVASGAAKDVGVMYTALTSRIAELKPTAETGTPAPEEQPKRAKTE